MYRGSNDRCAIPSSPCGSQSGVCSVPGMSKRPPRPLALCSLRSLPPSRGLRRLRGASRPAPSAAEFPSAKGKTIGEVLERLRGEADEAGDRAGGADLRRRRRTATRSASSPSATNRSTTPTSPSTSPRTRRRPGERAAAGAGHLAGDQARLPRAAAPKAPARRRPSTSCPKVDFDRNGPLAGDRDAEGARRAGSLARPQPRSSAQFPRIPEVGEKAPVIHTPTAADVGGDLAKIDTRVPPDQMHEVDFADVRRQEAGRARLRHPGALPEPRLRARSSTSPSRSPTSTRARPTSSTWRSTTTTTPARASGPSCRPSTCETEPWTFLIDRNGIIRDRIEGAYGVSELEQAMRTIVPG